MARSVKSPAKPRSTRPKPTPKKKPISSEFIDDEAQESDEGVLVEHADTRAGRDIPSLPQEDRDTELEDDGYESAFINDGDPYEDNDNVSERSVAVTPPPSPSKAKSKKGDETPRTPVSSKKVASTPRTPSPSKKNSTSTSTPSPTKKVSKRVVDDDVIDIDSSEEDLEAMDEDDSMFRKPAGVKPSTLPAPLATRSAAKRGAVAPVESSDAPRSGKKAKITQGTSDVPTFERKKPTVAPTASDFPTFEGATPEMNAQMEEAMNAWKEKYKLDNPAPSFKAASAVHRSSKRVSSHVDHDRIELDKAIKASMESPSPTPPPSTQSRKSKGKQKELPDRLSPDWEPPYSGDAFLPAAKSSPSTKSVTSSKPTGKTRGYQPAASKSQPGSSKPSNAASDGDVSGYMKKQPKPSVSSTAGIDSTGKALTMAQFMRAARGDPQPDEGEDEEDDASTPPADVATEPPIFLEDLMTYKANYDPNVPCGVFDEELQDDSLRTSYVGLDPLPPRRRLLASFDRNRILGDDDADYSTGGRVRFSSWYSVIPRMLAPNSMGSMLFKEADPNFINLSRVSPLRLSAKGSAGTSTTLRLQVDERMAVCLTPICVTESHVVTPRKIGGKSDRLRKWIAGVPHDYDWERMVAILNLVFGEQTMYGQINGKSVSFQTMISPEDKKPSAPPTDRFNRSVPSSMFSVQSPSKTAPARSSSSRSKALLEFNDTIPVYDARKTVIDFDADLDRLGKVLPTFAGEIPSGSFAIVGYTCSSYYGTMTGRDDRVPYVSFNILWVVVCGVPSA